jgi:hypothetical protein
MNEKCNDTNCVYYPECRCHSFEAQLDAARAVVEAARTIWIDALTVHRDLPGGVCIAGVDTLGKSIETVEAALTAYDEATKGENK